MNKARGRLAAFVFLSLSLTACGAGGVSITNEQIEATVAARQTAAAPTPIVPTATSVPTATPIVDLDERFQGDMRKCLPIVERLDSLRQIISFNMDDRSIMCGDYLYETKSAIGELISCFSSTTIPQNEFLRSARDKYLKSADYQLQCWGEFKALCDDPNHSADPTSCKLMNSEMDKAHVFVNAYKANK